MNKCEVFNELNMQGERGSEKWSFLLGRQDSGDGGVRIKVELID